MNRNNVNILKIIIVILVVAFCLPNAVAKKNKPDFVVVIDAGHGGKDPGSIDNEVKEKDINLDVALKLGEFIKKNLKGVKVVYTRNKDEYITLQRRADIANKEHGNLFISIHVNSAAAENPKRRQAVGASTHVLGPSKDKNNMAVVRRENSVIKLEKDFETRYEGFNPDSDESYIIFEMVQKKNQQRSIDLAQEIQKQLGSVAGRKDRGVHQNGFWVLWATSMPAVLVELDFICNPNSAKYMASNKGQNQLAKSIFNAVRIYYNQEKKLASMQQEEQEQPKTTPATTFIGEGYAEIGVTSEPERQPTAVKPKARTTQGQRRRRSESARAKSTNRNIVTEEIAVRTYPDAVPVSSHADVKPLQQHALQPTPAGVNPGKGKKQKEPKKPKNHKKPKLIKPSNGKTVAIKPPKPKKKAKVNRRRGQVATIVPETTSPSNPGNVPEATPTPVVASTSAQASTTASAEPTPATMPASVAQPKPAATARTRVKPAKPAVSVEQQSAPKVSPKPKPDPKAQVNVTTGQGNIPKKPRLNRRPK